MSSQDLKELISKNGLNYSLSKTTSLFNSRQRIIYTAQGISFKQGSSVTISLSNSDVFVRGKSSYLYFDVTLDPGFGGTISFGQGSGANVLDTVQLIHSSGVEVCHNRNVNMWNYVRDTLNYSARWFATEGRMKGYTSGNFGAGETRTVAIPLSDVCTAFGSKDLLPPHLLSGARLQISLAATNTAFVGVDIQAVVGPPAVAASPAALSGYTISNVYVDLDTSIVNDSSANALDKLSVDGSMDLQFQDYHTIYQSQSSSSVQLEMTKAIGLASCVYLTTRMQNAISSLTSESLAPTVAMDDRQIRLSSLYLPALPVRNRQTSYLVSVEGLVGKSSWTYAEFLANPIVRQSLNRSELLMTSGLPINASNSLRAEFILSDATANAKQIDMFVTHLTNVKIIGFDRIVISV